MYNRMVLPPAEPPAQKEGEMLRTNVLFKHIQVGRGQREESRNKQAARSTAPRYACWGRDAPGCAGNGEVVLAGCVGGEAACKAACPLAVPHAALADAPDQPDQRGGRLVVQHAQVAPAARMRVSVWKEEATVC